MNQEQVKKRIEAFFEFITKNNGQNFSAHNIAPDAKFCRQCGTKRG